MDGNNIRQDYEASRKICWDFSRMEWPERMERVVLPSCRSRKTGKFDLCRFKAVVEKLMEKEASVKV